MPELLSSVFRANFVCAAFETVKWVHGRSFSNAQRNIGLNAAKFLQAQNALGGKRGFYPPGVEFTRKYENNRPAVGAEVASSMGVVKNTRINNPEKH